MRAPLLCFILAAWAGSAGAGEPPARDYRPDSPAWNGLSRFLEEAAAEGCAVTPTDRVEWARLGARDVLFFIYPQSPIDAAAVGDYVNRGGRLLLADDFGAAGPAFEALQLRRAPARLEGVPREPGHPELPVARASLLTALGRSTPRLLANHPAAFETTLPATFALSPGQALVVEGRVGRGRFVAVADPSVLINNMLELDANRAFARALIAELCMPGRAGDHVHLVTGAFRTIGGAPPKSLGAIDSLPRLNEVLATLNPAAEELLDGDLALPSAVALCAAACALAWTGLMRRRGARHSDGRFVRGDGVYARSAYAAIAALPRHARADHRIALLVLRAEVMRRVGELVGPIPSGTSRAELVRRVTETGDAQLGDALAAFLAAGPAFESPVATSAVSRRQLARALHHARPILARTKEPDVQPR